MGNLCSLSISTEDTVARCSDFVVGQASYRCKLEQNLKALSKELEKLKARRDDVNQAVNHAEAEQHMKCLKQVELWLRSAATMIEEVEELIKDAPQELDKLCLAGCFSKTCKSSCEFGRAVARKLDEIVAVKNEGVFDKVADHEPCWIKVVEEFYRTLGIGLEQTKLKEKFRQRNAKTVFVKVK